MMRTNRLFPLSPLGALQTLDRMLETFDPLRGGMPLSPAAFPAVNLWEDAELLYAEAELPGVRMEDVEVLVVGNELTLKGNRAQASDGKGVFHREERGTGEFSRVIALPYEVDAAKVEATLKDGILTVVMPKAEQARARRITVKTA
jgi:HSP20 family protein